MLYTDGQTRRDLLRMAIAGAAGIALGAPVRGLASQAQPAAADTVLRLADDLFVLRLPGAANVVAHTGADGVLLVDGGSAGAADALMKAVAGLPGRWSGAHALQYALAPRADRLERAARQGR